MTTQIEIASRGLPWQSLAHALGWTLLHFLWQGALVAFVLWLVLGLLGGRTSQTRYRAACFALALMVAMPLITFAVLTSAEYKAWREGQQASTDVHITVQVGSEGPVAPWPIRLEAALDRCVPSLLVAWLAGAMYFMTRLNLGLLAARRLKSLGTQEPPEELQRLFDALRVRLGVTRAVRLLHSALVQVPTVIGWLRPVVLIPASCLTGLSTEQIEAILCHELAHVRRHDYLVSVLQYIAEALLFYHPAVWWVSKQVRRERECCCDEVAIRISGDVLAYARALSYLEEQRAETPEFVLGANGGVLSMRIQRLLGSKWEMEGSPAVAMAILTALLLSASLYFVGVSRAESSSIHAALQVQPTAPEAKERVGSEQGTTDEQLDQNKIAQIEAEIAASDAELTASQREQADESKDLNSPEIRNQMKEAQRQITEAEKQLNSPEIRKLTKEAQWQITEAAKQLSSPEIRNQIVEAQRQLVTAVTLNAVREEEIREQVEDAKLSLGATKQMNTGAPPSAAGDQATQAHGGAQEYKGSPLRKIGGAVSAPAVVYEREPEYTPEAREHKASGYVLVRLVVDQDGLPQDVQVLRRLGDGPDGQPDPKLPKISSADADGLSEKAVEAVQQYRFKPAMEDGKPVPVALNIEVNFQIF